MTPVGSALPAGLVLNNDFNWGCPGLKTDREVGNTQDLRLQRQLRHFKWRPFRQIKRGTTKRPGVQAGDTAKVPAHTMLPRTMISRSRISALRRAMRPAVQPVVQRRAHTSKSEQQEPNSQKPAQTTTAKAALEWG